MKKIVFLSALSCSLFITQNSPADTLAQWTFETSVPLTAGPFAPEVGSGSALGFHSSASAVYSNPVGNGSAESFSANFWSVGDYYQFQVSTVGYTGVGVSFDQTSSTTGPRDFSLSYSTDGSSFTSFATYVVLPNSAPNAWNGVTASGLFTSSFNLAAVVALDNFATVYFRLVDISTIAANGGTVATTGTDRVDNFTVTAFPVPEPSSGAFLGGFGLLGLFMAARSRK